MRLIVSGVRVGVPTCLLFCLSLPTAALAAGRAAPPPSPAPTYALNGTGNNLAQPTWGSTGIDLRRRTAPAYADERSAPAGSSRLSARALSNLLSAQAGSLVNDRQLSDFVYVWGQFLDHDIDLTSSGSEKLPILVPAGDPFFDPLNTASKTMSFTRSAYNPATGTDGPRQQLNAVTAWVDGSQVYGADAARAAALRAFSGGRLQSSAGNLLPFNTAGLANANDAHRLPDSQLFLAGDVRANENPELASLQTLFMREHNRLADQLAARNPGWDDERLYQEARRVVIGELQQITYNEFLPALLGRGALAPYRGYRPQLDASISNEFATAAFRFGHSLLDGEIGRLQNDGQPTPEGPLALRDAFFNTSVFDPTLPDQRGDIDPFLKSAASGNAQEVDLQLVDDVRNFLFGPPGAGGFDLAALNIQRGRDHGLADYNTVRAGYGLPRVRTWAQISRRPQVQQALAAAYGSVNDVDLWVGGLAEEHVRGGTLGPTFTRILVDQFTRLRDGDRLWWERTLPPGPAELVRRTTLARVLRDNTALTQLQPDVFFFRGAPSAS